MTDISHLRNRLTAAIDRQGRADTSEDWLADQSVIDSTLTALENAGQSRQAEYDRARNACQWSELRGDPIDT